MWVGRIWRGGWAVFEGLGIVVGAGALGEEG